MRIAAGRRRRAADVIDGRGDITREPIWNSGLTAARMSTHSRYERKKEKMYRYTVLAVLGFLKPYGVHSHVCHGQPPGLL